jgi:branched-chain amino acid transport system permease protein
MRRIWKSRALRELLRPLGQLILFVAGSGAILSAIMLLLALIMRGSGPDRALIARQHVDLFSYTLINLPQVLIDSITLGFVYAAIALGYSMVYGVLEFINFAHSEIFATGAFVGVEILIALQGAGRLTGISPMGAYGYLVLALLAGTAAAGLLAVILERVAYRPLRAAPRLVPLISAIGASFFLQDAIRLTESLTTGQFYRVFPSFSNFEKRLPIATFSLGTTSLAFGFQVKSAVVIISAVLMLMGLNYLVSATKIGKAMRAVAQDRPTASLMGVNVNQIISLTFLVGGGLGGAAGLLYALKFLRIDPYVGFYPGLKAFTAAVLGGIGNLTGALLGGVVLGMLENFSGAFLSVYTMGAAGVEYKDIIAFAILILVLIFRPTGLLGEEVGQKA